MKIILLIVLVLGLIGIALYHFVLRQTSTLSEQNVIELSPEEFLYQELVLELKGKYPKLNFELCNGKICSEDGIEIELKTYNHRVSADGSTFQINFYTSHQYLHSTIEERLLGIGENDTAALKYGVRYFLAGQFPVIVNGLGMKYEPEMDFDIIDGSNKMHWHLIMGDILTAGELTKINDSASYERTYSYIKPLLLSRLQGSNQDFHWLRYYICKTPDGQIVGECFYDNEPYQEGLDALINYAATWETTQFASQKQFIMFRHCGKDDK
jgi:hypothetical protein